VLLEVEALILQDIRYMKVVRLSVIVLAAFTPLPKKIFVVLISVRV